MSQQHPQQPGYGHPQQHGWGTPPQPPKKTPAGKIIGFGCLGVVALLIIIGAIGAAVGGGSDSSNDAGSSVATSSSPEAAEKDDAKAKDKADTESQPAPEAPVKITASKTDFAKSILADSSNYTSVKVTITNNSDDTISINPLYFTITDSDGTKHTQQLAADKNQIDTVKLAPGENISGTITGDGKFTAQYVTYTDGFLSDPVRVEVS